METKPQTNVKLFFFFPFSKPTHILQENLWVYRWLLWSMYAITELLDSHNYPVSVFSHFIPFCYSLSSCHCMKSYWKHLGTEAIFGFLCTIHLTCTWSTQDIIELHKIIKLRRKYHKSSLSCEIPGTSITIYVQKYHEKSLSHFISISCYSPSWSQ